MPTWTRDYEYGEHGWQTPATGPTHREGYHPIGPVQQQAPDWVTPGIGVDYSPPEIDVTGDLQFQQMPHFQAPGVHAPQVSPPEIPETPEVDPGYYTDKLPDEPTSELEQLIDQIIGREPEPAPEPVVDHDYINEMISQYGLEPRSDEEIRDAARAIAERQAFQKEQVVQQEIERFEREFPNEFRQAQEAVMEQADQLTGEMQEEMAARGMFYSSVMAGAATEIDSQTMQHINDIASDAASHVAGLRAERRDIEEWKILEQEVVQRQLEEQEYQRAQQLAHMHVEIATWADQQALDRWYREESMRQQQDQLELQAIQLKQQEAERLGQHYANAMMADHPLVQGTLQNMGISSEEYAQMDMVQQSHMVNQIVNYNEVEQQMRQREFQMRATVAEIQLQNANMQMQASIASGQMQMEAMRLNLQAMQHQDQMQLAQAELGLRERQLEHQIGIDTARLDLEQQRLGLQAQQMAGAHEQQDLNWEGYNMAMGMLQDGTPEFALNRFISSLDPVTQQAVTTDIANMQEQRRQEQQHQPGPSPFQEDLDVLGEFFRPITAPVEQVGDWASWYFEPQE